MVELGRLASRDELSTILHTPVFLSLANGYKDDIANGPSRINIFRILAEKLIQSMNYKLGMKNKMK